MRQFFVSLFWSVCRLRRGGLLGLLCLFSFCTPVVSSSEIRTITVETNRIRPETLCGKLGIKKGEKFVLADVEKARAELEKSRIFRTLDVLYKEDKHGVDIRIRADDHVYLMTMGLFVNGKKRSGGASAVVRNLFKRGEEISLFAGGGRNGFDTRATGTFGRHTVGTEFFRQHFEQGFYANGWVSANGIFSPSDDKGRYENVFLGSVKGVQKNWSVSYGYALSSRWRFFLVPTYEYYRYADNALDTGNHSHISAGVQYNDDVRPETDMDALGGLEHLDKADLLRDLPRAKAGKTVQLSYTSGGRWIGSDFLLNKWGAQGKYGWEFPSRQRLTLFAKAQYAVRAPFSNGVESSELLFGMGIYDREQRGKQGFSVGLSWTCFPLRNRTGVLAVVPFYEQAYVSDGDSAYTLHSGVGVSVGYRLWRVNLPLRLTFTHNLADGSRHGAVKVGGRF